MMRQKEFLMNYPNPIGMKVIILHQMWNGLSKTPAVIKSIEKKGKYIYLFFTQTEDGKSDFVRENTEWIELEDSQ